MEARRWGVIAACVLSAALVAAGFLTDPAPSDVSEEVFAGYAAQPGLQALHSTLLHYGFALWIVIAFGLVWLVRGRGAWLANTAAVLAVLGLTTLPGMVLFDFHTVAVTTAHGVDASLEAERLLDQSVPFLALVMPAILAATLAVPVAALGAWRAGLLPSWAPAATFAGFAALMFAGFVVGPIVFAAGLLALGAALVRVPRGRWFETP